MDAFFIVGAPRCGTTAMSRYLKKHPNICFSDPKETHFFLFADRQAEPRTLKQEFLSAFFPDLSDETIIVGDGSVSTLYSSEAIQQIQRTFRAPKFIVMLRDPVDMMRSYHGRLLHLQQEDEKDFQTAWELQEERKSGRRIPRKCSDPRVLQYSEIGRLGHYSSQLVKLVGEENCMAIFFDDFLADTLSTYKNVLSFLDLPYDGRETFNRKNSVRTFKSGLLQSLYSGPLMRPVANQLMKNPVRAAKIQRAMRPYRKKMKKMNSYEAAPPPLPPVFKEQLSRHFAEDVDQLGKLFGRNLEHWSHDGASHEARA
jgi:hypothetical protein